MNLSNKQKLEKISNHISNKKFYLAKEILEDIIRGNPQSAIPYEIYAEVLENIGFTNDANIQFLFKAALFKDCSFNTFYKVGSYLLINNPAKAGYFLRKAFHLNQNSFEVNHDLGVYFGLLNEFNSSFKHFSIAKKINGGSSELLYNMACLYDKTNNYIESIKLYKESLKINNNNVRALLNLGIAYQELKIYQLAIECFDKAIAISQNYENYLIGMKMHVKMLICDWSDFDNLSSKIKNEIIACKRVVTPFAFQAFSNNELELKKCAEIYGGDLFPPLYSYSNSSKPKKSKKLKIGYVCGEFRDHATTQLIIELLELQDRNKIEVYGFDTGYSDNSDLRKRIINSFDHYINLNLLTAENAFQQLKKCKIDILINLNGYYGRGRFDIFRLRPAPIQINFLGFPGTLGLEYFDYIIADSVVIPEKSKDHYTEKIIFLPNSYQPNDSKKSILKKKFSRAELGLPEDGFIFCCFNNSYKITPLIFSSWLKILGNVDKSVLWLLDANDLARNNLRATAEKQGVQPNRIIFAKRVPLAEHLARHKCADLFLDTTPYNAHTTASDALWAGTPIITMYGNTFPGRVAASLLKAVNLENLITYSIEDYITLAINIASNPVMHSQIKLNLEENLRTCPLFNSALYVKHFEKAMFEVMARYHGGLSPDHIYI